MTNKKYSVFQDLQDGSKLKCVAFMVFNLPGFDLAI